VVTVPHGHDGHQAGITQHVDLRIAELERAAVAFGIHRRQFVLLHGLHAHAAGMEGEAVVRADLLVGQQHGRHFGFHRGVGARHDLADAVGLAHGCFPVGGAAVWMRFEKSPHLGVHT